MSCETLFPPSAERVHYDGLLTAWLAEARERVSQGPVAPTIDLASLRRELAQYDFSAPVPLAPLLGWTIARLERGVVHMTHPRYLGLFNPAPSFPAQCADRIVAAFNPQLASATTAPAAVEIEAHVIAAVARRAGMGREAGGHFTSGGSEANYTAMICALTRGEQAFATLGARAFAGQPVFYVSQDSHLAWIKIAHQAGIGRAAARLVPTDGAGRMSPAALAAAIRSDQAQGAIPFMAVATAGTTNAGMIDPLVRCAQIARDHGLWYHVDAAWGGAMIASARLRGVLEGMGEADSITIDAHKWFATTMGCGMFLTAHPRILSDAFTVTASYMPSHAPMRDPYVTTAQWSRRFLGLRLFLSLAASGWSGYAAHVERAVDLARLLAQQVAALGWSVVNTPDVAVVCMIPPEGAAAVRDLVRAVVGSGGAWVSAAMFEGREVVRACITHGQTTPADVVAVAALLEQHAHA
jgi:glutamate/tyrosine decarboxylase-like PLP-dependent enzyme